MRDPAMPNEPILLATDGLRESDAAVHAAADLADATQRPVTVLSVLEPPPLVAGEYGFVVPSARGPEDRQRALLARVRKQIAEVVGRDPGWPIELRTGNPAATIANVAASVDAALIVMGLGEHHLLDRALGTETTLHTLRTASTPILAVPQMYRFLPSRAVVGVDFGDAAAAGAHEALTLIPSLTWLSLVHVAPHWDLEPTAYKEWQMDYQRSVAPALERVLSELDAPLGVTVTTVIREGKPARELLQAAEDYEADLIIAGSKGLGFLDRMLVGSTASGVVRGAHAAVFAFPIAALARATAARAGAAEATAGT